MKIIVLKENHIKEVFCMKDAIQASKDALESYSQGKTNIPLRTNIDLTEENGQSLYMPGYSSDANALGVKIVSVYPDNLKKNLPSVPSTMILLNHETGQVCSILDGTYLTKIRTGAVSGLATDLLSRKDSKIFALIGTGGQAESQLEAVLSVRDIEEVRVFSRNEERAQAFVDKMNEKFKDKFHGRIFSVTSSSEAVENADIITCVTTSKKPVFDGRLVKKGAHINGVGSYTPDMQEIDEYLICNASKIYVDTKDGALNESGDLIIPMKKDKLSLDNITGDLGDLINNQIASRENDDEITIFKTVGTAVLDIVTAKAIYDHALENGIGDIIEL